jgi:putative ABC transport system ATP-binding protein
VAASAAAAGSAMPVISVRNLKKTYIVGDIQVHALRGVDVDVEPGEFVCVTGPSGSGKSTFMHILGCLDKPTAGHYVLDGQDVSKMSRDDLARVRNHRIGFVFQGFNLLSRTSAIENVEMPLLYSREQFKGSDRHKRARAALEIVGLLDRSHHHPNQLSGGQQQRVAIARALINTPSILLADEPTGNLDSRTSIEVMDVFQRLNIERGITILLITHEHDIAEYGTRTVAFRDGHIVRDEANTHRRMAKDELAALPPPEVNGSTDTKAAGLKRKAAPRAAAAGPAGS